MRSCVVVLFTLAFMSGAVQSHGALVTVDADAFVAGTNISNAFAGVTLSSVGAGFDGDHDASIFAIVPTSYPEPFNASTGNRVFGTNDSTFPNVFGGWGNASFRVDFATPTLQVLLDAIGNNHSDYGRLVAYDSGGNQLDTYSTGQLTQSQFETMMITRAVADISYVIASGVSGDSLGFDNLQYDAAVPEPSTSAIWGLLGGLGFAVARRRRK